MADTAIVLSSAAPLGPRARRASSSPATLPEPWARRLTSVDVACLSDGFVPTGPIRDRRRTSLRKSQKIKPGRQTPCIRGLERLTFGLGNEGQAHEIPTFWTRYTASGSPQLESRGHTGVNALTECV
jgi:hypothetical protein